MADDDAIRAAANAYEDAASRLAHARETATHRPDDPVIAEAVITAEVAAAKAMSELAHMFGLGDILSEGPHPEDAPEVWEELRRTSKRRRARLRHLRETFGDARDVVDAMRRLQEREGTARKAVRDRVVPEVVDECIRQVLDLRKQLKALEREQDALRDEIAIQGEETPELSRARSETFRKLMDVEAAESLASRRYALAMEGRIRSLQRNSPPPAPPVIESEPVNSATFDESEDGQRDVVPVFDPSLHKGTPYRDSDRSLVALGLHPTTAMVTMRNRSLNPGQEQQLDTMVRRLSATPLEAGTVDCLAIIWTCIETNHLPFALMPQVASLARRWAPNTLTPEAAHDLNDVLGRAKELIENVARYPLVAWTILLITIIGLAGAEVSGAAIGVITALGGIGITAGHPLLESPRARIRELEAMIADVRKHLALPAGQGDEDKDRR